jgi:pimeloyl-ACP methyl ester carboxylesterase
MNPAALPLVLLPGLHGSVRLFDELVARLREATPRRKFLPLPLPTDTPQDYPALRDHFVGRLEKLGPFALLAESFSAPLALHLAASPRLSVGRMILAGAYCAAPRCAAFRLLPLRRMFSLNPPKPAVRHFLVGKNASEDLVETVRTEIQAVRGGVLAERVRVALALKESDLPPADPAIPTLLLQARHDALLPQKARAALESHLPDARVVRIDAPHLLLQTAPDRCAEAIGKLLRGET